MVEAEDTIEDADTKVRTHMDNVRVTRTINVEPRQRMAISHTSSH